MVGIVRTRSVAGDVYLCGGTGGVGGNGGDGGHRWAGRLRLRGCADIRGRGGGCSALWHGVVQVVDLQRLGQVGETGGKVFLRYVGNPAEGISSLEWMVDWLGHLESKGYGSGGM